MRLSSNLINPLAREIDHKRCMRDHREHHVLVRIGALRFNGDCTQCGNSWQERAPKKMTPSEKNVLQLRRAGCDGFATNMRRKSSTA